MFITIDDLKEFQQLPQDTNANRFQQFVSEFIDVVIYEEFNPFYSVIKNWVRPLSKISNKGIDTINTLCLVSVDVNEFAIARNNKEVNSLVYNENDWVIDELLTFIYNNFRIVACYYVAQRIVTNAGLNILQNSFINASGQSSTQASEEQRLILIRSLQSVETAYKKIVMDKLRDVNYTIKNVKYNIKQNYNNNKSKIASII